MTAALILAEHDNRSLGRGTLHAVTAATKLGEGAEVHLLVAGHECAGVAERAAAVAGVARVIHVEHPAYAQPVANAPHQLPGDPVMPLVAAAGEVAR